MAEEGGLVNKLIIEKLTHENYDSWAFRMMMVLVDRDLWGIVNGDEILPADASSEKKRQFVKRSQKALAIIGLHVSDEFLPHIMDAKNAKELWKTLEKLYTEQSQAQRIHLRRQLQQIRLRPDETISKYVNRLKGIAHRLSSAGYVPGDDEQVCALLNGLPEAYKTLVTVLESQTKDLTMSSVTTQLLLQESKIRDKESMEGTDENAESAFGAKEMRRCFYCKRRGHIKKDCRKRKYDIKKGKFNRYDDHTENVQVAFLTDKAASDTKGQWILDSGASSHMTCNKSWINNFKEPNEHEYVKLGDGRKIDVCGSGEVCVQVYNGSKGSEIMLKNVLYVPNLATNLISLPKTTLNGLKVFFAGNSCTISTKHGKTCAKGIKKGNLYTLMGKARSSVQTEESMFMEEQNRTRLWHFRFGHLNFDDLKALSSGMVEDMKIDESRESKGFCVPCALGKGHRTPLENQRTRNTVHALELVHSDLCGPITPVSLGGSSYVLTFIDDYSRVSWVKFLKKKSEAAENIRSWISQAEKQYGKEVKQFRSDRGGEYVNNVLKTYFEKRGIIHELTVANTPAQNGVAERLNRTLFDKARCMLQQLPKENRNLWAEAIATANYLRNRSPTRHLKNCTPYEKLVEKIPNVKHLRIFGSRLFIVKHKHEGKLDSRSDAGIMVGYATNSKGYRVYNQRKGQIEIRRDLIFDESSILDQSKEEECSTIPDCKDNPLSESEEIASTNELSTDEQMRDAEASINNQGEERRYPERKRKQTRFYTPGEVITEDKTETAALVYTEPQTYGEAISSTEGKEWKKAMEEEIEALRENKTWELCALPPGCKPVECKWVFRLKRNEAGEVVRFKARVVAKGYTQRQGIDYDEIFAPVTRFTTLRTLLSIAAVRNLEIVQIDIKTAFLNGELEEEVYMRQPEGYTEDAKLVCKLKKALYGLKQAPRVWYMCLSRYLKELNFNQSYGDPGLYIRHGKSGSVFIIAYVDDLLVFGEDVKQIEEILSNLERKFDQRNLGCARYFLGIQIKRDRARRTIHITQEHYTKELLEKYNMKEAYATKISIPPGHNLSKSMCPTSEEEERHMLSIPYRSLVGGLMYLAVCTRPDIAYAVGVLSRFMTNPGMAHWKVAKGVLRYLKGSSTKGIVYGTKRGIEAYCDADFAGDVDSRRSTTGWLLKMSGGTISWASRVQPTVALSTTEAEYMAAAEVTKEIIWLKKLLSDIETEEHSAVINISCDNQSCIKLVRNPVLHQRSRHIDIRYHFIREKVQGGIISFIYCNSEDMVADILTKAVTQQKQEKCSNEMGLTC